nr:uncharacterized protein LOC108016708 [Drosophila suzukii]
MFNKSIVVALIVCACYLGTIDARPGGLDLIGGGPLGAVGPLATGALGGATGGLSGGLANGAIGSVVPSLTGGQHGVLEPVSGLTG